MATKFLDNTGLSYFWSKIKAWCLSIFVSKTGDQNIEGQVTLDSTKNAYYTNSHVSSLYIRNSEIDRGILPEAGANYTQIVLGDKEGELEDQAQATYGRLGLFEHIITYDNKNYLKLSCYNYTNEWTTIAEKIAGANLYLGYDVNGNQFCETVSTSENRTNGGDVLTRDWIPKDDRIVHTTGNETIDGYKVFNNHVESRGDFHTISDLFDGATVYNDTRYQYCINTRDKNGSVMADSYYGRTGGATGSTVWAFRLYSPDKTKAGYLQLFYWPSSDTFTATAPIPPSTSNGSDIATTSWVRSFGNDTYLPLTGGTLTGSVKYKRNNHTRGTAPSTDNYIYLNDCVDSANNRIGLIETAYLTDKSSRISIFAYNTTVASGANIGSLGIGCTSAGNVYTFAPTPSSSDNSTQIATTAWVKSANCVVHTTSDETIDGKKYFTSGPIVKSTGFDVTDDSTTQDLWRGFWFCDKNNQDIVGQSIHYGTNRAFSLRMYDKSGSQYWMMFWVLGHDGSGRYIGCGSDFRPASSNNYTLGNASYTWKEIWCNQSSINSSSDERIKSNIKAIPDNVLDVWENVSWIEFQYNDAISEKGENARLHTGLIAQRVASVFKQSDVQIDKYGFYLYDKWDSEEASFDENGKEIKSAIEAGDTYGIRYTEALCMEAAYTRRENARLKKRVADLEERLEALELLLKS